MAFALAMRVAMMEFEEEMRKQGVGWATELENWAYVDDITIATTAELAPLVMTKLRETLERHGLELRKVHSTLSNTRKSRRHPQGNDAILELDARGPHDLGDGQ